MKNYYKILKVQEEAHASDVKAAFRQLAKTEHPDVNKTEGSKQRFIEILEAYQVLSNNESKVAYDFKRKQAVHRSDLLMRKESEYKEWFDKYQQRARQTAIEASEQQFDDFVNTPIYKTAMVVSRVYNYIFAAIGIFMIFGPFILWHLNDDIPEVEKKPLWTLIFPSILGVLFTYGIYYFLFKQNQDDE